MASSKQSSPTKPTSKEDSGQGKLYAPPNDERRNTNTQIKLEEGTGQGKLYSPQADEIRSRDNEEYSKKNDSQQSKGKIEEEEEEEEIAQGKLTNYKRDLKGKGVLEVSRGVAGDMRRSLSQIKDRILDKLAALPAVPAEALDNARQSLESIVKDVTHAAQGFTKDALHKIKLRLAEILPSLSPTLTGKIVDDVEREVLDMSEAPTGDSLATEEKNPSEQSDKKSGHMERRSISPSMTSSTISPPLSESKPYSFSASMGRLATVFSLQSRL